MRLEAGARRGEQLFLHSMICFRLSVANSDTHMAYAINVCSHSQSWEAQIFEYDSSSWYFSLFPFEFEPSRVCRRRCNVRAKRPIADGWVFYECKMFVWKGYENRIISMSSSPRSLRWFNEHLPSVGAFYDSSIEIRTKRNSGPKKASKNEVENGNFVPTDGRWKVGMLHLPETLSSFSAAPSARRKRFLEREKKTRLALCYAIYGRICRCELDVHC